MLPFTDKPENQEPHQIGSLEEELEQRPLLDESTTTGSVADILRPSQTTSRASSFRFSLHYFQKIVPIMLGRRKQHSITLRDGRKLCYVIDGPVDPTSVPCIFAFHAMFLSGESFLQHTPPQDYSVVCINRPGYHGSCPVAVGKYCFEQFSKDVEELANHLGVDQFSAVGHSSGGPNALACASFLSDRVVSIGIMAGDPEYAEEAEKAKEELQRRQQQEGGDNNHNDPDTHHEECHSSRFMEFCIGCLLPHCMRFVPCLQVSNGLKNDFFLERQQYPFRTENLTQPAIVVIGDKDTILPNKVAAKVHKRLPNSQLEVLPGVGHNQLLEDDILDGIFRTVLRLAESSLASEHPREGTPSSSINADIATEETTSTTLLTQQKHGAASSNEEGKKKAV